jgi:hypothetical protein
MFKAGDRAYWVVPNYNHVLVEIITSEEFVKKLNNGPEYARKALKIGCIPFITVNCRNIAAALTVNELVPENIYNSPLYQALKEE